MRWLRRPELPPLLLGLALALPSVWGGFVFDDHRVVQANPRLAELSGIPALFLDNYWGDHLRGGLYRPLVLSSFALERSLWGAESAFGFHLVNALLYALCCAAVARTARRLGGSRPMALAAGLLFACNPIHTEAVAPVVGRSELSSLLFLLIAVGLRPWERTGSWKTAFATAAAFLASILCKETGIALLPFLAVAPLLPGLRPGPSVAAESFPRRLWRVHRGMGRVWLLLAGATGLWFALRYHALDLGSALPAVDLAARLDNPLAGRDLAARMAGALALSLRYARMALWPWPLSADYSFRALVPTESLFAPTALLGLACWLAPAALLVAWAARRDEAPERDATIGLVGAGLALYLAALFPVSNLALPIGTVFAERLLFAPTAGSSLVLAALVVGLAGRAGRRGLAGGLVRLGLVGWIALWSAAFWARIPDWRNELTLARRIVLVQPESARGHAKYGTQLYFLARQRAGDERERLLEEALAELTRAIEIEPRFPDAWAHFVPVQALRGDVDAWAEASERYYRLDPGSPRAVAQMAFVHVHFGRHREALELAEAGLDRHGPVDRLPRAKAFALLGLGRAREAAAILETIVRAAPDDGEAKQALERARRAEGAGG